MIAKIQETAALVMAVCLLLAFLDRRSSQRVPDWYAVAIMMPLFVGAVVLVITTIINIWS